MPAFLVHGVPDTTMLWDELRTHLTRTDVIAPSIPGFTTPLPDGFDATKVAYVAWLISQVEAVGEPVDVVGHDWGAILVQRLVSVRPDLVRTWAVGSGPLDTEYAWHDTAKLWQTPGAGEQLMQAFTPDAMAGVLAQQGLDPAYARSVAEKIDDAMKDCILKLYRSATRVAEDWTPLSAPVPPGLVIFGADDPYVPPVYGERLAARTGAKFVAFEECSHWWPHQRAAEAAALLNAHWASI
jgi:pimeloyl-ACP methyl ester carboxylesterase